MKDRISATIESETLASIDALLKNKKYRNKSHVIESAVKLLKETESKNAK